MNLPAQIQEKLSQRQTQAIIVGALILALVAFLQLVHSRSSQPLVALLESQQNLCDNDLERMEFAIGKSGIGGCKSTRFRKTTRCQNSFATKTKPSPR